MITIDTGLDRIAIVYTIGTAYHTVFTDEDKIAHTINDIVQQYPNHLAELYPVVCRVAGLQLIETDGIWSQHN